MRFDDSLATVLSADMAPGVGARSAWHQLVDLIGRGRAPADDHAMARLRSLRPMVPSEVRGASARMLAFAQPPAALVALFAEDDPAIAAPVLRATSLPDDDWLALLPRLGAAGRSVLRHRRDLSPGVRRGLASFGSTDFVLSHDAGEVAAPLALAPAPDTPLSETPFRTLGEVAGALPLVAEAQRIGRAEPDTPPRFEIADLVARIDAFRRDRPEPGAPPPSPEPPHDPSFSFETDAAGTIRWVEGAPRAALVGLSLTMPCDGTAQLDAVARGAFRRRQWFADARLEIGGGSSVAGSWRLSGAPLFDPISGRFTGMRGTGRRPRPDQQAERGSPRADSLRQLVHELRTPATAIIGFAEMIGTELLGPVPDHYRARAETIRDQAAGLVTAIEDLDTAARIEARALDLRDGHVPVATLVARVIDDLAPLAALRGVAVVIADISPTLTIGADDRAAERLVARLLAALVSAGQAGERIALTGVDAGPHIAIAIDRPRALTTDDDEALFRLDAEDGAAGAPLLGIGFTLRLVRNLAAELGGELAIGADRLTLRLPAVVDRPMEQAAAI